MPALMHCHEHLVVHARGTALKADPTRTTLIRRRFMADISKRIRSLIKELRTFFGETDALGLRDRKSFVAMAQPQPREYQFQTDAAKLESFNKWFEEQVKAKLFSVPAGTPAGKPWTAKYVESAYKMGELNSYIASRQEELFEAAGIGGLTQEQFLKQAFLQPERVSKVQLLSTRSYESLKGFSAAMASETNRILAQAMVDGTGPSQIAKQMVQKIQGLTSQRAMTIARTEVINAHSEGQLDAFEDLGVDELGVNAEWSTAGDDRVCPLCAELEGSIYTVEEARGLIPYHPNCRCAWIPAPPELPGEKKRTTKGKAKASQEEAVPSGKRLGQYEGNSVVSVVRELGAQGWSYKEVRAAFDKLGIQVADQTIRIQIKNKGGARAQLSTEAMNRLRGARTGGPVVPPIVPPTTPTGKEVVVVPATPAIPGEKIPPAPTGTRYTTAKEYRDAFVQVVPDTKDIEIRLGSLRDEESSTIQVSREALRRANVLFDAGDFTEATKAQEEHTRAVEKYVAIQREKRELDAKIAAARTGEGRKKALELLTEQDNLSDKIPLNRLDPDHRETAKTILGIMPSSAHTSKWDRQMLSQVDSRSASIHYAGLYHPGVQRIEVSDKIKGIDKDIVFAHEYGHHISYQIRSIMDAQNALYEKRTAGKPFLKQLPNFAKGFGGRTGFETVSNSSIYAGSTTIVERIEGIKQEEHVEVISVGIEELFKDPINFAEKDPEWFDMVVGALKGLSK